MTNKRNKDQRLSSLTQLPLCAQRFVMRQYGVFVMESYQERIIKEKQELDEKLSKLGAFGRTDQFVKLSEEEQGRMNRQHSIMEAYSAILGERIDAFRITAGQDELNT